MEDKQLHSLRKITEHQCQLLDSNVILLKDCALIHITPSGHLMINDRLPERPHYLSHSEFVKNLGVNSFGSSKLPYVLVHWNTYCELLHPTMRKGWRFNFDVVYKEFHIEIPYITYDVKVCQNIWLGLIRWYRDDALRKLDIEFNMVLETGDKEGVEEIGLIKNMLRDLPKEINIEQYDTFDKLISFWPTLLLPAPDWVAPKPPEVPVLDDV